ncbi:MAG TPA: DUF1684 domain-containing protein [Terriglobales bacterium]|jgi:uncharacterized protein (DUF1684 family)|nr:DUF1684 domain-containing protein [Terriglobales bacterium]
MKKQHMKPVSCLAIALFAWGIFASADDKAGDDQAEWQRDLLSWRAKRAAGLQAPEGWLSLIALGWLQEGDNSFGSSEDCRVQISGKIPAHTGVVRLEKGALRLRPASEGFPRELLVDGQPAKEQALLADDADKPSKLTIGTITIIVIHRDDRYALRVKDLQAATRTAFHGLRWYDPNASYRVHARWIPYNPPKVLDIPTVLGTTTHMPAPGVAEFTVDGKVLRLEPVLEDPKSTDLFFIMRDATSKTTTYGAGRFLYTEFPDHGLGQPGEIWLDFNRLFNPPCAFTAYATCPLPPPQNRLTVPIPAGEQRYHD